MHVMIGVATTNKKERENATLSVFSGPETLSLISIQLVESPREEHLLRYQECKITDSRSQFHNPSQDFKQQDRLFFFAGE